MLGEYLGPGTPGAFFVVFFFVTECLEIGRTPWCPAIDASFVRQRTRFPPLSSPPGRRDRRGPTVDRFLLSSPPLSPGPRHFPGAFRGGRCRAPLVHTFSGAAPRETPNFASITASRIPMRDTIRIYRTSRYHVYIVREHDTHTGLDGRLGPFYQLSAPSGGWGGEEHPPGAGSPGTAGRGPGPARLPPR